MIGNEELFDVEIKDSLMNIYINYDYLITFLLGCSS